MHAHSHYRSNKGDKVMKICIMNVSLTGHIKPTLDLIKDLQNLGHEVIYIFPDGTQIEQEILNSTEKIFKFKYEIDLTPEALSAEDYYIRLLDIQDDELINILSYLKEIKPDCIMCDSLFFGGVIFSEALSVPLVTLHCTRIISPNASIFPPSSLVSQASHKKRLYLWNLDQRIKNICKIINIPNIDRIKFQAFPGSFVLILIPEWLDGKYENLSERFIYYNTQKPLELEFPTTDREKIYISLGSIHSGNEKLIRGIIEQLIPMGFKSIIVSSLKSAKYLKNIEINEGVQIFEWCNQEESLRGCNVFISHGGMGGIVQAIASGIPHLIFPLTFEQNGNAHVLQNKALGLKYHDSTEHYLEKLPDLVDRLIKNEIYHKTILYYRNSLQNDSQQDSLEKILNILEHETP